MVGLEQDNQVLIVLKDSLVVLQIEVNLRGRGVHEGKSSLDGSILNFEFKEGHGGSDLRCVHENTRASVEGSNGHIQKHSFIDYLTLRIVVVVLERATSELQGHFSLA
jgi:hypothetical protein